MHKFICIFCCIVFALCPLCADSLIGWESAASTSPIGQSGNFYMTLQNGSLIQQFWINSFTASATPKESDDSIDVAITPSTNTDIAYLVYKTNSSEDTATITVSWTDLINQSDASISIPFGNGIIFENVATSENATGVYTKVSDYQYTYEITPASTCAINTAFFAAKIKAYFVKTGLYQKDSVFKSTITIEFTN